MLILSHFSDRKAEAYSNKDIILTLPSNISIYNIKWLSMYCISYRHNFGEVFFPENLAVPVYVEPGKPVQLLLPIQLMVPGKYLLWVMMAYD